MTDIMVMLRGGTIGTRGREMIEDIEIMVMIVSIVSNVVVT